MALDGGSKPKFRAESEFRRGLEGGLRTALAALIHLLWMEIGPYPHPVLFIGTIVAVLATRDTAGATIAIHLVAKNSNLGTGLCIFFFTHLLLRRRRLDIVAKRLRGIVEGGICALLASLFPYPRLAIRESVHRAQYVCYLMHRSMDACVDGFIAGRDERKLSKVRLLIEQASMRLNLKHIKELNTACRMELTVLCWGQAGALVPLEILDNVTKGLLALKNDAEQEAFVAHLTPRLRDVKAQTAEASGDWIAGFKTASSRPPPPSHAVTATSVAAVGKGSVSVAVCKDVRHAEGGSYGERLSPVLLAVARSIDKLVQDYQRARLHILYGRNDPNEKAVWESFEGSVSYQGGLQDDDVADSLHDGGTPLPSPPAPHLFAAGTAQKDARIIFEETPIGFDRGIHDKVAADWARHGYRGPFARGCFMSNLVTFSVMLARLVDMEVALERNRGLSAFDKLKVAVCAMAADTWEALSPFIAFGSQDATSLHCVKVAGILTAASLFTLVPELSVKFYPGAWVAFSCGVILAEDTGSAVAMGSQRLLGSPTHGYAAVVAAFTAVLIMVGIFTPAVHQAYSPVVRIQNTIIGVVLYFALDNIIWPARAITALQRHLAGGLGVMRKEAVHSAAEGLANAAPIPPPLHLIPLPPVALGGLKQVADSLEHQAKRAEQSFFTSCTDELWSAEVKQRSGIMTRVGALLRIARMSLQDAEDIFSAPPQPTCADLFGMQVRNACAPTVTKEGRVQQAQRLLQLQVEAELLHEAIDQDMVTLMTIGPPAGQAPQTSVQFALRFTTTTFSVLRLHKGLLTLGHAITDLLEREARIFYYT
ncbi:hypothetical protein JKP88DRAFT_347487 [Tribonema minus]|uniref:Uncharacterized protein n=1 Tax=Tribonema minus TaxID=303371 RepID=A0A835ZI34_9STRA|nr:hypothetical protein JKP88DRAFT_347487 [Tribonema minus]